MMSLYYTTPINRYPHCCCYILGIRELEEIEEIYNLFRTMSWINITLHCLRLPVPTAVYRLIVQAGQTLRWADDKPLKTLAGIAARAR